MVPSETRMLEVGNRDERAREQLDLFLPLPDLSDIALRDYQEAMQRPFFSLSKNKRVKPIQYVSPDGKTTVHVSANPEHGMATIWDADVLIFLVSALHDERRSGRNNLSRVIRVHPAHLLTRIKRGVSGRAYQRLIDALDRLQTTTIKTNIRAKTGKEARFSWIDGYSHEYDEETGRSLGMSISMSEWLYEGVLAETSILSIPPTYFDITSGIGRWLWRVGRKHAGGNGKAGFAIGLQTLYQKSGSERNFRQFKADLLALVAENNLPELDLSIEGSGDGQKVRMRLIAADEERSPALSSRGARRSRMDGKHELDDETLAAIRAECPGWDLDVMREDFDKWVSADPKRMPRDYAKAFAGFMRRHHERRGYEVSLFDD